MHAPRPHRVLVAAATSLAALAGSSALAQTVVTTTWNTATGDWSDPTQWTGLPAGSSYPANPPDASQQFHVRIGGGAVSLADWLTISRLTMSGGTLAGDGILEVLGDASFANATLGGETQTRLHGSTTQAGTLSLVDSHALINTGAYNWAGALNLGTGTSFANSGTVLSAGNGSRTATAADATAGFENSGTFRKTGTGTTTFAGLRFDNRDTGTVDVQGGTLALAGGGESSGSFLGAGTIAFRGGYNLVDGTVATAHVVFSGDAASPNRLGASAELAGSSVTVTGGTTEIAGIYQVAATTLRGGTLDVSTGATTGTFTLSGGTLAGKGVLSVTGTATLTTGTMTGPGVTRFVGATSQTGTVNLGADRVVLNEGAYNWAGTLNFGTGAVFANQGSVTTTGTRTATAAADRGFCINEGAFSRSGSGTTSFANVAFNNAGTIDVHGGTLALAGGGFSVGNIAGAGTLALRGNYILGGGEVTVANLLLSGGTDVAPNALMGAHVTSATVNLQSGVSVLGDGYEAGATTVAGTARLGGVASTRSLTLARTGILTGPGVLAAEETATLAGGTIRDSATLRVVGTAAQTGALTLDTGRVQVSAGATYDWANTLALNNGSVLENFGTVVSAGSANRTATSTDAAAMSGLLNHGTFRKTGTGTTTFSGAVLFNDGGTVDIQGGTLSLVRGMSTGSIVGSGTLALGGGSALFGGDVSVANLVFTGGTTDAPNLLSGARVTSAKVSFQSGVSLLALGYQAGSTTIAGTVRVGGLAETRSLHLTNTGVITGPGILTANETATLAGGTIRDGGTLGILGSATQTGALTLDVGRIQVAPNGTYQWANTLNLNNGSLFENSGTVVSAGATSRTATTTTSGSSGFVNRGTFLKSGTGTTTFSGVTFFNDGGIVDIQGGTLAVGGGLSNGSITGSGTLALRGNSIVFGGDVSVANIVLTGGTTNTPNILSGAHVTSPTVYLQNGVALLGPGYDAGSTTIAGTATLGPLATTGTLNLTTTGTLNGGGLLAVTGQATLAGGTIRERATLALRGTAAQTGALTLDEGRLQVAPGATYNWAGSLTLNNGSLFENLGTVVSAGTANRAATQTAGSSNFANRGTFTKTGTGTTTFNLPFYNQAGTVDVQGGTLSLGTGGGEGTFLGAGTLAFRGGYQLVGNTTISTANVVFNSTAANPNFITAQAFTSANVRFSTGTTNIYGAYAVGATTISGNANFMAPATTGSLSLSSTGTIGGTGRLDVTGAATLAGGTMRDAGHTRLFGPTTQTGTLTLSGLRTLTNEGTFDLRGNVAFTDSGYLVNHGTLTAGGSGTRTLSAPGPSTYFANSGTFATTTSTNVMGLTLDNTGRIDVRSGTLTFSGPVLQAMGGTLHRGEWIVGNGTSTAALAFTHPDQTPITTIAADASVTLNGTRTTFAALNAVTTNAGTLRLLGGRTFTVQGGGVFANSGTLELGGGARFASLSGIDNTGTLRGTGTITGPVTSSGLIAPGASPGLLTINGDLTLGATSLLALELGGTERGLSYDALNVAGLLTFDGTLDVLTFEDFHFDAGTSYDLFDWGRATGTFDLVNLPTLDGTLRWDTANLYTTGVVTVIPEPSTYAALLGVFALVAVLVRRHRAR